MEGGRTPFGAITAEIPQDGKLTYSPANQGYPKLGKQHETKHAEQLKHQRELLTYMM